MSDTRLTQMPSAPARCGACSRALDNPAVCSACHQVFPVDNVNYFQLLGIPAAFDIDPAELQRNYLNLAQAVHPDRLLAQSPEVSALSLRTTSQLNRARTVLLDPVLRAEYLLGMAGGPSAQEEKTVPQDVLMETMEIREAIDDAKTEGDLETLEQCQARARREYDATVARIGDLARQLPGDADRQRDLRLVLNSVNYYQRMLDQF